MKWFILGLAAMTILLVACAPNPCAGLEGSEQALCVIDAATTARDGTLCTSLELESHQTWCLNEVANATQDERVCDLIIDNRGVEYCKLNLYRQADDPTACAALTDKEVRNDCYGRFAKDRQEWSLCEEMSPGEYREHCIEEIARKQRDIDACLAMNEENTERDACLFTVSYKTNNTEGCKEIKDEQNGANCVINIAVKLDDEEVCEILGGGAYSNCLYLVTQTRKQLNATSNTTE